MNLTVIPINTAIWSLESKVPHFTQTSFAPLDMSNRVKKFDELILLAKQIFCGVVIKPIAY